LRGNRQWAAIASGAKQRNQQSAISNQQSAISNQQSAISNQQKAIVKDRGFSTQDGVWFEFFCAIK